LSTATLALIFTMVCAVLIATLALRPLIAVVLRSAVAPLVKFVRSSGVSRKLGVLMLASVVIAARSAAGHGRVATLSSRLALQPTTAAEIGDPETFDR